MDPKTIVQMKKALEDEHIRLVAELKQIARPGAAPGEWEVAYPQFEAVETGSHSAQDEEADEVEEYEVRLATEQSLENRLLEVTHALERMTSGTYGVCLTCHKPIPPARLQANPAAAYDMDHEGQNA
ncbi:MAG: TraR/DksA C4-type zinc finger protein [Patescibacteria group bacterium]